jgi:hypothetical protein
LSRLFLTLFGAALALLPWNWFPPFPWLHEHAQWSDAVFAAASIVWLRDRRRDGDWPKRRAFHVAIAAYVAWACASHIAAGLHPRAGTFKLLGIAELAALAIIAEDVASRPRGLALIARVTAWTSVATGVAALVGVASWAVGSQTPLVSHPGDLDPGAYTRAKAGFPLPNLLASYAIFAGGVVAYGEATSSRVRRLALAAISLAAFLSLSRGILGLILAILIRTAETTQRRRVARAWAIASAVAVLSLTYWNVGLNPIRPWDAHLRPEPSSRWAAVTTSMATFARTPLFGSGPENLPGRRGGIPCPAHLTPLDVAATFGLPALLSLVAVPILAWRERVRPTDRIIWGVLAGLGVDALGQDVENFRHVWLALGIAGRRDPAGRHGRPQPAIVS